MGQPDNIDDALPGADAEVLPDPLPAEPMALFRQWFELAQVQTAGPNPTAMTLATTDADNKPHARVVLCKQVDDEGSIVFYTNYHSAKGLELESNPHAAAVFFWDHLGRQIRVEGPVEPLAESQNDAYFATRPISSRLGAWASQQSRPLESRDDLLAQVFEVMQRFDITIEQACDDSAKAEIPRPPHWGGYRLWAETVEFWISAPSRLHDRAVWRRELKSHGSGNGFDCGPWKAGRLQP